MWHGTFSRTDHMFSGITLPPLMPREGGSCYVLVSPEFYNLSRPKRIPPAVSSARSCQDLVPTGSNSSGPFSVPSLPIIPLKLISKITMSHFLLLHLWIALIQQTLGTFEITLFNLFFNNLLWKFSNSKVGSIAANTRMPSPKVHICLFVVLALSPIYLFTLLSIISPSHFWQSEVRCRH